MYYLKNITLFSMILIQLPIFIFSVPQEKLMAQGQRGQDNASATEMMNLRKTIIPQAEKVNEANSELINICTDSPNASCDNTMKIIYNDCVAYPAYVATHIPSCGDSKLFRYLAVRGLLE
jgi:hypothetical protein